MALNLGEAIGSDPGNRRARLNTASGSANESRAALLTACAWGYVGEAEIVAPDEKLDAVLAKTYRLLNPVRRQKVRGGRSNLDRPEPSVTVARLGMLASGAFGRRAQELDRRFAFTGTCPCLGDRLRSRASGDSSP